MLKRSLFVFALMMTAATLPARADDVSNRVDALEQQLRQLTGQIEELTFEVKQLRTQAPKKMGQADAPVLQAPQQQAAVAPPPVVAKKKPVLQSADQQASQGVETIEEAPVLPVAPAAAAQTQQAATAPGPTTLGTMSNSAAQANDGTFQGQVIVAPGGIEENAVAPEQGAMAQPASLQPETPDDLFLRSEKALLQLQYGDAETGFKEFISKYPGHNLAGSAEFKLGETYFAQQNYTDAAQAYLTSYKQYPKGRRAPDSLLKLGLSLSRMGQKDQACTTIGSVDAEFPNAVEVKKRAQAEFKRAGC